MFPGYLFFQVRAGWEAVCSTKGIASVFLCDGLPSRVRQDEFEYLRGLEDDRGLVVLPPRFNDGDSVRVVKGSYSGVVGMVQGMSVAGRLSVLWSMFGKEVSLQVSESSLELA
jgi:transcription antitermination factor NusG